MHTYIQCIYTVQRPSFDAADIDTLFWWTICWHRES